MQFLRNGIPRLPERLKSGRLAGIGNYFKQILGDYKTVALETAQDMRERPVKASVYLSLLGATGYLVKHNPSERQFHDQLLLNANQLLLVGDPIRNPHSDNHMQQLLQHYNAGLMRRLSVGVVSFMWVDNYHKDAQLYEAKCKHLKVGWLDWKDRVVDVGVLGQWIYLEKSMTDYDINPSEWEEKEDKNTTKL